jgi:lysophospholipase L1-like esterase
VTPSFVATVAKRAGVALHGKVAVTRIVEEGAVEHLVTEIRSSPALRDAIRSADLITITVGANEIGEAADGMAPRGCGSSDGSACVRKTEHEFEKSYGTMLTQLTRLRPSSRTAYRLLTSYNTPGVFAAAKGAAFTAALKAENRFVRSQAARRHMKGIDVFVAFNGADGSNDPQAHGLTVADGHPSAKGSATIAQAVIAAGFAPLH